MQYFFILDTCISLSGTDCDEDLRQIWLNYECECITGSINSSTEAPQHMPTATASPSASTKISVPAFSAMIVLQIIVLAIVSTGWAWTCWIVKKTRR